VYIGIVGILYHDMGIVMGIPNTTSILKEPCRYCILGFCSMMNVYRIITSLGARIYPIFFNHGKGSKTPLHSCPKPH
jgi:hypothetical protein